MSKELETKFELARAYCKKVIHGYDKQIDEFFNGVRGWYLRPELNTRPVVINLWGMTSSAKSTLVRHFIDQLDLSRYVHYKNIVGYEKVKMITEKMIKQDKRIIVFDEFHELKNISKDKLPSLLHELKDFLGDGRINIQAEYKMVNSWLNVLNDSYNYEAVMVGTGRHGQITLLSSLLQLMTIFGEENFYHERLNHYIELYHRHCLDEGENPNSSGLSDLIFRPTPGEQRDAELLLTNIIQHYNQTQELMSFDSIYENKIRLIQTFYRSLFLFEILRYVNDKGLLNNISHQIELKDTLMIFIGNLDSLFHNIVGNNGKGIGLIEDFSEMSNGVTVRKVKSCLSEFLKPEFISRMGPRHIVFPALSLKGYCLVLNDMITEFTTRLNNNVNIKMSFDDSIVNQVLDTAIIPSQGVRVLQDNFSYLTDLIVQELIDFPPGLVVEIGYFDNNIQINFPKLSQVREIPYTLPDSGDDEFYSDEEMANVAIHEIGHVLAIRDVTGKWPSRVTIDNRSRKGITINEKAFRTQNTQHVRDEVTISLAGIAAEAYIAGGANNALGTGHANDLQKATSVILTAIRDLGLFQWDYYDSNVPVKVTLPLIGTTSPNTDRQNVQNAHLVNILYEENAIVRQLFQESYRELSTLFDNNRTLLLQMGKELLTKKRLNQKDMLKYETKFISRFVLTNFQNISTFTLLNSI